MGAAVSRSRLLKHVRRILERPFHSSKSYHRIQSSSSFIEPASLAHEPKQTCYSHSEKIYHLKPAAEDVRQYASSPDASRASCKFADSGPREVEILDLKLYRREVPGSDGYVVIGERSFIQAGLSSGSLIPMVGVGLQSPSGEITPLVIIENGGDDLGIHFTGRLVHDPDQSLVACLRDSSRLHPLVRHIIYLDFLRNLQNRSATFIWDWWRSGVDMDRMDKQIREGQ
ncbi:hypothetical protein FRC09_018104 [Ceratobasidium sp. 395]|nr:hypothetical protein FRC09_018104 [Ceratobasidium sp. 395]